MTDPDLPSRRDRITRATAELLRAGGPNGVTLERVADHANCAKGLVNYHFRSRGDLLAAAADRIAADRMSRWRRALVAEDLQEAIDACWRVMLEDVDGGTTTALLSLETMTDAGVRHAVGNHISEFARAVAEAVERLLDGASLRPTTPVAHLGLLLSATIHGAEAQLRLGAPAEDLQEAFAAGWLGILSQTTSI